MRGGLYRPVRYGDGVRPFFSYYGGKWRAAHRYPPPVGEVIEPFAGSAGYSVRWRCRRVRLFDVDENVVSVWRYLIGATEREILSLPDIAAGSSIDDYGVPPEARALIGFWLGKGVERPRRTASKWLTVRPASNWGPALRRRIADQLDAIRDWSIEHRSYECAPDIEGTWFVDPPYSGPAGMHYRCNIVDYSELAQWCEARRGRVIVCEQNGADWLSFRRLGRIKATRGSSDEMVWTSEPEHQIAMFAGGDT